MVTRSERSKQFFFFLSLSKTLNRLTTRRAKTQISLSTHFPVGRTYWEWSGRRPSWGKRAGRRSAPRPGCWGRPCTPPPRPGCGPPMEASEGQNQGEDVNEADQAIKRGFVLFFLNHWSFIKVWWKRYICLQRTQKIKKSSIVFPPKKIILKAWPGPKTANEQKARRLIHIRVSLFWSSVGCIVPVERRIKKTKLQSSDRRQGVASGCWCFSGRLSLYNSPRRWGWELHDLWSAESHNPGILEASWWSERPVAPETSLNHAHTDRVGK